MKTKFVESLGFCGYDDDGLMVASDCLSSYEAEELAEIQAEAEYGFDL